MNVVDTEKKWILDSQDAPAYLQTNVSLLSLLVNVRQGIQPDASGTGAPDEQGKQRQALLDTEWTQFLKGTLSGVPSSIQSWPLDSAVLAVHAKHAQPGIFPYSFWTGGKGPALQTMVGAIYDKVGRERELHLQGQVRRLPQGFQTLAFHPVPVVIAHWSQALALQVEKAL